MVNDKSCDMPNKIICYKPWKLNSSIKAVIPSNSRPIPQARRWHPTIALNDKVDQCGRIIQHDNAKISEINSINHDDYVSGAGFIPRRYITSGGRPGHWVSATPNPIKHWRKQLFPRQGGVSNYGKVTISQMERPGGTIIPHANDAQCSNVEINSKVDCSNNSISIYIPKPALHINKSTSNSNKIIKAKATFSRNYYRSSKAYLQSRVKLYEQKESLKFNSPIKNLSNTYEGLYKSQKLDSSGANYSSSCFNDCSCIDQIIYKPGNPIFTKNSAMSNTVYIKHLKQASISQNQYNITNIWGLDGERPVKNYPLMEFTTHNYKKHSCCFDKIVINK